MFQVGSSIVVFPEQGKVIAKFTDDAQRQIVRDMSVGEKLEGNGETLLMLPWTMDGIKVLRNMNVPQALEASPAYQAMAAYRVEGKHVPMAHQKYTAAFICYNPRSYVLNEPRTGKTGSLIMAMDYLQKKYMITGGVLVVTTKTTIYNVWEHSIKTTLPKTNVQVVYGPKRKQQLEEQADFYVTNYDSIRIAYNFFVKAVKEGRIGAVILDELTHVGNGGKNGSMRHKTVRWLVNNNKFPVQYVVGVTGSPAENVEFVYGMCQVVNIKNLPCHSKTGWREMTMRPQYPGSLKLVPKKEAPEIIYKAMQPAVCFKKKDLFDLPPVVVQNRECAMSKDQARVRSELRSDLKALLDSQTTITASNGGVLVQKLMQVAQGFCINEDKVIELDHEERTRTIMDIIGETSRKVVIFACYKARIQMLMNELKQKGITAEYIDGSVPGLRRSTILRSFQDQDNPRVLIAHPTTVAYGVELSRADTMIFDGPPLLGGFIYAQALERLSSKKQTADKISIINIIATPEEKMFFSSLDKGKKLGDFISQMFVDIKENNEE